MSHISSSEDMNPEVIIGGFRFADQQTTPHQTADNGGVRNPGSTVPPEFRRPEVFERMAADKPGEELAPDATVWKLYIEEAGEHDQELVKGRHASLDMLLLFAALFSAILTAFLIESKNMLQQDPADVSVALLLQMTQSQQRVELGLPPPPDLISTANIPEFTPPMSARWINGIWFTSLGLSLSTTLIAMLGKEWLTAFLASRPRPAHDHALLRQSRLEGLEIWRALPIIALLPSLLHVSLLLFAVGLVIYLWTTDTAIAAVLAGIVGVTSLFYVTTTTLGAVYEFCPFVTEISGYFRRATSAIIGRGRAGQDTKPPYPTVTDLRAVLWLASNARDPAVVDCSYQALAGLHHSTNAQSDNQHVTSPNTVSQELPHKLPVQLNQETTLVSLISTLYGRFERLFVSRGDATGGIEGSMPRYMNAILALSTHISDVLDEIVKPSNSDRHQVTVGGVGLPTFLFQLLNMTENPWSDDGPPLGADTYSSLLVTGMRLIRFIALMWPATNPPPLIAPAGSPITSDKSLHAIDVVPDDSNPSQDKGLHILHAYYSRWLARVSALLRLYSEGIITLGPRHLEDLLDALADAAQCIILNPLDSISTHHPQIDNSAGRTYHFVVPSNKTKSSVYSPEDLLMGPLGSLVALLRNHPSVKDESHLPICLAALKAYSAMAPILLQQVLGHSRDELVAAFDMSSWSYVPTSDMVGIRYIAMRQALITTRFLALSRPRLGSHIDFCHDVIKLMCFCITQDRGFLAQKNSHWAVSQHSSDLVPLLEFAGASDANFALLTEGMRFTLIDASNTKTTVNGVSTFSTNLLAPPCFLTLIRMIGSTKTTARGVGYLLQAMVRRMRTEHPIRSQNVPWNNVPQLHYLYSFTHSDKGYTALASAISHKTYAQEVAVAISDITHIAAGQDPAVRVETVELRPPAVPGLLDVVSAMAKHCTGTADHEMLYQFSNDALDLLGVLPKNTELKMLLAQHPACGDLLNALKSTRNNVEAERLAKRVDWAKREASNVE